MKNWSSVKFLYYLFSCKGLIRFWFCACIKASLLRNWGVVFNEFGCSLLFGARMCCIIVFVLFVVITLIKFWVVNFGT